MDSQETFTFGEKGLNVIESTTTTPEILTGYFTGFRYNFGIKKRMYVDVRDVPYLLRTGYELV